MAESALVGVLRVLMTANTAEYTTGLKGAAKSTKEFEQAVTSTEDKLKKIGVSARGTEDQLRRLAKSFSGEKMIRDAVVTADAVKLVGTTAQLTEKELRKIAPVLEEARQKAKLMGAELPATFHKVADSVKAQVAHLDAAAKGTTAWGTALGSVKNLAIGFAAGFTLDRVVRGIGSALSSTVAWADGLNDLAEKTGISTTALQQFEGAAEQSGVTLDTVTSAVQMLGDRLASGDKSAAKAVQGLGLSLDALMKQSPDEAFLQIAQAIGEIENPMQRAAVASDLFGKAGKELTQILNGQFVAAVRNTSAASAESIKLLGDFADKLTALKREMKILAAEALGPLVGWFAEKIPLAIAGVKGAFAELRVVALQFVRDFVTLGIAVNETIAKMAAPLMQAPGPAGQAAGMIFGKATKEAQDAKAALGPLDLMLRAAQVDLKKAEQQAIALAFGLDQTSAATDKTTRSLDLQATAAEGASGKLDRYAASLANTIGWLSKFPGGQWQLPTGGWNGGGGGLYTTQLTTNNWGGIFSPYGLGYGDLARNAMGYGGFKPTTVPGGGFNWGALGLGGLTAALPYLSQMVTGGSKQAQIGGTAGGALGGILGSQSLFGGLKGLGGFAGVLGGVAPFLGPIMGVLGGLIGKLFGPSEGRQASQARGQWIAGMGGNEAFNERFRQAQVSPEEARRLTGNLMSATSRKEVEQAQAAIEAALARNNALLAEQEQIEGRIADVESQRQQLVDSLKVGYSDVLSIAQKYNLNVEGLGAAINQTGTTANFTAIINDLEALKRAAEQAGGELDWGGALSGMKEEIGALVSQALRMGTEVPENMRPFVEELLRTGQLIDENGEALSDLSGLKWGAAVETESQKVNTALGKLETILGELNDSLADLVAQLRGDLPNAAQAGAQATEDAINGINPRPIVVRVDYDDSGYQPPTSGPYAARGGIVTPAGIQYRSLGGAILALADRWRPRGTDTVPAMLTPGELVLTLEQQRGLAGAVAAAGVTPDSQGRAGVAGITEQTVVVVQGGGSKEDVLERIMAALPRKTRQNDRGFRTLMRDALGVA